jgi:hypothetical protein
MHACVCMDCTILDSHLVFLLFVCVCFSNMQCLPSNYILVACYNGVTIVSTY